MMDPLALIQALKSLNRKNLPSVCVFIYNCKNGVNYKLNPSFNNNDRNNTNADDADLYINTTTLDNITPLCNANAQMNGYIIDDKLFSLTNIDLQMSLRDFGITILMMYFAEFYSNGQYPLYMNTFKCIKELEIIERFLLAYNQKSIKLPPNLATDREFGIMAQSHRFCNYGHITVELFNHINLLMRTSDISINQFLKTLEPFDISIVESFYIFTSITKNCKIINECHDLQHNCMPYTFQKPIKTPKYDGDYWFELPNNAIWFAYHQGKVKYSAYVSCDITEQLKCFKIANVLCVVVGFVYNNCIYPLIFEHPSLCAQWDLIIKYLSDLKLNCVFRPKTDPLPEKKNRVHFVRKSIYTIFKLDI